MAVLAEAGRISRSLSTPLYLIHADGFDSEKEERFRAALRKLMLDDRARIHFESGEPSEAILKAQREENIDLLVAGAMETETAQVTIPDFSDLSRYVFHRAVSVAERNGSKHVTILYVQTTFAEAKEKALRSDSPSPEESLQSLLCARGSSNLELDYHLLRGNTGFTACEFIQASGTDLVVMPSRMPSANQPTFASALDWIIQVIPANLWVVRNVDPSEV